MSNKTIPVTNHLPHPVLGDDVTLPAFVKPLEKPKTVQVDADAWKRFEAIPEIAEHITKGQIRAGK